jgi:hypothetical protein
MRGGMPKKQGMQQLQTVCYQLSVVLDSDQSIQRSIYST